MNENKEETLCLNQPITNNPFFAIAAGFLFGVGLAFIALAIRG